MRTVQSAPERVVMLYRARGSRGDSRFSSDESPDKLATARDDCVRQFVEGEAKERLSEMKAEE